jgi:type IV pilus assembly protein PilV
MKLSNHIRQTGFTLLEVMISLVIFSIGMLGLAGIQATSIQSNSIAYMRTIAMQSAYDMADIIRANADFNNTVHSNFSNVTTTIPGTAPTACQSDGTAPNCSHAEISAFEIYHWKLNLKQQLPSGRGTVVLSGGTYTITVMWDQDRTGATGENCSGNSATDLKCYVMQTQI